MAASNRKNEINLQQMKKLIAFGTSVETAIKSISESFTSTFDDEDLKNPVIIRRSTELINQKFHALMSTLNLGSLKIPVQQGQAAPWGGNIPPQFGQGGNFPPPNYGVAHQVYERNEPPPKVNRSRPPSGKELPKRMKSTTMNWLKGLLARQNDIDIGMVQVPRQVETQGLWIAKDLNDRSMLNFNALKEQVLSTPDLQRFFNKSKRGRGGKKKKNPGNANQGRKKDGNGRGANQNNPHKSSAEHLESIDERKELLNDNDDDSKLNEMERQKQKSKPKGPENPTKRFGKYLPQYEEVIKFLGELDTPLDVKPSKVPNLKTNLKKAIRDARGQLEAVVKGVNTDPLSEPQELTATFTLRDIVFIVDKVRRGLRTHRCIIEVKPKARIHELLVVLPHHYGAAVTKSLQELNVEQTKNGNYLISPSIVDDDEDPLDRKLNQEELKDFKESNTNLIWLQALTMAN